MRRIFVLVACSVFSGVAGPATLLGAQTLEQMLAPPPTEEECRKLYPRQDGSWATVKVSTSVPDDVDDPIVGNLVGLRSATLSIAEFTTSAREDVERYIDTWSDLAEVGPDGEIRLKEGAIEKLFSESAFRYDCILHGAQAYYDRLTGEAFNRAIGATLLIAARLKDILKDELERAETEEARTSYRLLLESVEKRESEIEEVKKLLIERLGVLNKRIQGLKERKKHVVYALLIEDLALAQKRLKNIADDVAQFSRLVEQVTNESNFPL